MAAINPSTRAVCFPLEILKPAKPELNYCYILLLFSFYSGILWLQGTFPKAPPNVPWILMVSAAGSSNAKQFGAITKEKKKKKKLLFKPVSSKQKCYKRKETDLLNKVGQLKSPPFNIWKTSQLNDELAEKGNKIFSKENMCVYPCAFLWVTGSKETGIDSYHM